MNLKFGRRYRSCTNIVSGPIRRQHSQRPIELSASYPVSSPWSEFCGRIHAEFCKFRIRPHIPHFLGHPFPHPHFLLFHLHLTIFFTKLLTPLHFLNPAFFEKVLTLPPKNNFKKWCHLLSPMCKQNFNFLEKSCYQ